MVGSGARGRERMGLEAHLTERVTPPAEIPDEFQMKVVLPGGGRQVIDAGRCYNWDPGKGMVECGSVASHADQEGF